MLRLTDPDQIKRGLLLDDPRLATERQYFDAWRGVNDRYGPAPAQPSGLIKVDGRPVESPEIQPVRLPFFRSITRWWVDALWGEPPQGIAEDDLAVWEKASRWRSVKGTGVALVYSDGTMRAIDPSDWWPVRDPVDADRITADVITWHWMSEPKRSTPNRVRVVIVPRGEGASTVQDFELAGQVLGDPIGPKASAGAAGVAVFGDGASDYEDVWTIVNEMQFRYGRLHRALNRTAEPHLSGPFSHAPDGYAYSPDLIQPADVGMRLGPEQITQLSQGAGAAARPEIRYLNNSQVLPTDGTPWQYIAPPPSAYQGALAALDFLLDQLVIATGIPATAFGLQQSQQQTQSGVSRERQLLTALQRVRHLRRELERAFTMVARLRGGQAEEVQWPSSPFAGFAGMAELALDLFRGGLITEAEGRELIGYSGGVPLGQGIEGAGLPFTAGAARSAR